MLLLLQSILNNYSDDEILQMCKTINKDYNIYDPEDVRWAKIGYVLNKTNSSDIELLRKTCLSNKVVNDMIFNYYFCERVIKYYFSRGSRGSSPARHGIRQSLFRCGSGAWSFRGRSFSGGHPL